ncbi:MAG: hypothetical protein JST04_12475 [Bdellovibrionales bacterium]|nr:hypothetical protein [Bdellovibrionales bacterium]
MADLSRPSQLRFSFLPRSLGALAAIAVFASCAPKTGVKSTTGLAAYCPDSVSSSVIAGSTGSGKVFKLDPLVASGNASLSPGSSTLGNYTTTVTLPNLLGYGTLKGTYVDVITDACGESYGAYSTTNDFRYEHGDGRFAEVMNYHYGNQFRSDLASSSALYPSGSFLMIANCDVDDNAFYSQGTDSSGNLVDFVCMGRSTKYPDTTSFSEDGEVMMHELQHGTTGHAYSSVNDFNVFDFDEAGAINEGLSDFIGLIQGDSEVVSPFKNFEFSRWALGLLFDSSAMRGAAKCPVWTADYPTCSNYSKTPSSGFSATGKRISFAYPDGLGWPYAGYASGKNPKDVWASDLGFEEIHQTAPIVTGAMWEIYQSLVSSSADSATARHRAQLLLMETIKTLPQANASDPSPVTMPVLATKLNAMAATATAGAFSGAEQTSIANILSARGLTGLSSVGSGWASVGSITVAGHAGLFFNETSAVGPANNRMHAGEKGMIWFDIANSSANTAAAPLIKVTSSDSRVTFSGASKNPGYVSPTVAFIRYGKINGSNIVNALNNGTALDNVGITNSYFNGVNLYGVNSQTALYIEIGSGMTTGTTFNFTVQITPANGSGTETLTYPVTMQ